MSFACSTSFSNQHCEGKKIYLIFEYIDYDLKRLIQAQKLSSEEAVNYLYQILNGILYCHSNRVIHRDLKSQNILIDAQGNVKIADFGLARSFTVPLPTLTHEVITLWYRAPEILLGQKIYTPSVDIWSIGCMYGDLKSRNAYWEASVPRR